ncbi:AsmA family protein [Pelagibacterium halotolerans]|uniref:AsmA family protein n=1 Tax=Pelagibacterium halotolerans TaxID=531813 RepID=UPI00384B5F3E
MANRIYIAIGSLAILILAAAFIVPLFVPWNDYKGRMEAMAADALGLEVSIAGDMDFVLLPQPRLRMREVRLGPAGNPLAEARLVEADFSLMDFLRDRFRVTELSLIGPQLNLTVNAQGALETPITLAETASASNVSIENARIEDGAVRLTDMRSGESWQAGAFNGELRMTGLRGPFTMQALAEFEGVQYGVQFGTSTMNAEGAMQVTASVRPVSGAFSVAAEGLLETGTVPRFEGQLRYRRAAAEDTAAGDAVLRSPVTAGPDAIVLEDFVFLPDENQATTRLTGTATMDLGAEPWFDAQISGGVVTLLPPVVVEDDTEAQPFELIRLLRTMPQPIIPPLPGRVSVEVGELGLRGIGVRDLRFYATSDGEVWTVEELSGRLSGDTTVKLTGTLGRAAGWPAFDGTLAMASGRLDSLSLMWQRPRDAEALFGLPGSLNARFRLAKDGLWLEEGLFALGETTHEFAAQMRFGDAPRLDINADLSTLNSRQSSALIALLPPIDPAGPFGVSFPEGRLDIRAEAGAIAGQNFADLALTSRWGGDGVTIEGLQVEDFGGMALEGSGRMTGTLAAPVISGSGHIGLVRNARVIDAVFGGAADNPLRRAAYASLPAELDVVLDPPGADGAQSVNVTGRAGGVDIELTAGLADGVAAYDRGRITLSLEAMADSGAALLEQLGLAPVIAGVDGAILSVDVSGDLRDRLDGEITLEGGGERIDYAGSLMISDPREIQGQGEVSFLFEDTAALMDLAGADGVWLPRIEGDAQIGFVGTDSVTIEGIDALAGERGLSGHLTYATQASSALLSGALRFEALDVETLAAMLGGPAALINTMPGSWPDGPIAIGQTPRQARGRVAVSAPALYAGDDALIEALAFDFSWEAENIRLRGLFGEFGGGTIQLDAALCCASALPDKSVSGRFTLNGVTLDALLPETPSEILEGTLTSGGSFQGSGDSYRALIGSLNGEGSFSVSGLSVGRLSPDVFEAAAGLDNLVEIEPQALEDIVVSALDAGSFTAEEAGGLFSLVGGDIAISNLAIDGDDARLLGGGTLDLEGLSLDTEVTLAATENPGGNGLITETTGRISVLLDGPLAAPERTLDLTQMVDAIQMRALEMELDELEALRAEQEARQQALAEEQARLMEEEARRQAEELLRQQQEQAQWLSPEQQQALDAVGSALNGDTAGPEGGAQGPQDKEVPVQGPLDLTLPEEAAEDPPLPSVLTLPEGMFLFPPL